MAEEQRAPRKIKTSPKLSIGVSREVIATSAVKDSSHCMIAEAIAAAVPQARFISVDLATIRFTDPLAGVRYVYLTPRTAQVALLKFDQGEKPEPFQFRLQNAHVLMTGSARRAARAAGTDASHGARLQGSGQDRADQQDLSSKFVPIRVDGQTPPLGPLAGSAFTGPRAKSTSERARKAREANVRKLVKANEDARQGGQDGTGGPGPGNHDSRVGRRREFGLRAIIR